MHCYCVTEHGQPIEIVDQPIPELKGTEVLLRVKAAGLCHTDLHLWEGFYDLGGGNRMMLADRGIKPPMTLSHEVCGELVSTGGEVNEVEIGKRYLIHPWIGCGKCAACKRGDEHICSDSQSIGVFRPGGFAEYIVIPHERYLIDIDGIEEAEAVPLACAGVTTYSAINKFGKRIFDDPVVVIGAGGLGLMAIQLLKAIGSKRIIVADIDQAKRDAALTAGADEVIDAKAPDAAQQISNATNGGARAVLDLVGATPTVDLAISCSSRGGHIVICGLMGGDLNLSLPVIPMRPLKIEGSYVGSLAESHELVDLVKRTGKPSIPVIKRPMSEINTAMQDLHHGKVIGRTVLIP